MTVTDERVSAYADGELSEAEAKQVELELERSPELRAKVQAHHALRSRLAAHFAPIAQQPVPERLIEAVRRHSATGDNLVEFRRPGTARRLLSASRRLAWFAAPALAASIAWVVIGTGSRSPDYAGDELAIALDRQLVATQSAGGKVRVLLTFRDRSGRYCRGYAREDDAGVACHDADGWRIMKEIATARRTSSEYRQAGAAQELMADIQEMAAGHALDAAEERKARARFWQAD